MARTTAQHEWSEDHSNPSNAESHGSEWEVLRNELRALLQQVEVQVEEQDIPKPQAFTNEYPTRRPAPRKNDALRNVRNAVDRVSSKSETNAFDDPVASALEQIRARQSQRQTVRIPSAPFPDPAYNTRKPNVEAAYSAPFELDGFIKTVQNLGLRIERFETNISNRLDDLGQSEDVSAQVAQLSEVIEMLAAAVGETGQVKRIEGQIAELASYINVNTPDTAAIANRVDELTATVAQLIEHQVHVADRDEGFASENASLHASVMEHIEASIRTIYDRIDTLETAQVAPIVDLDRISDEMAALAAALDQSDNVDAIMERIDALGQRIQDLEAQDRAETLDLRDSVESLRELVLDTLDQRFSKIEAQIDRLEDAAATQVGATDSILAIETQLRVIAQRVEDTGAQLQELSTLYANDSAVNGIQNIDFDALADMIVARTAQEAHQFSQFGEALEKSDLQNLEERLIQLFSVAPTLSGESNVELSSVKNGLNQVDERLGRLERLLEKREAERAEAKTADISVQGFTSHVDPSQEKDTSFSSANTTLSFADEMPTNPVSGETTLISRSEQIAEQSAINGLARGAEVERKLRIDPNRIARPAKPVSSLESAAAVLSLKKSPEAEDVDAEFNQPEHTQFSRASFIESARRSARTEQVEVETSSQSQLTHSQNLIAKALARFNKAKEATDFEVEAETVNIQSAEITVTELSPPAGSNEASLDISEPDVIFPNIAKPSAPRPSFLEDKFENDVDYNDDYEVEKSSFLAKNKRGLLFGTGILAVIGLAIPLAVQRTDVSSVPTEVAAITSSEPVIAAEALETVAAPTHEAALPVNSLLNNSETLSEQEAPLIVGGVDDTLLSVDPLQTNAISPTKANAFKAEDKSLAALSQQLPTLELPAGLQPESLGQAALNGDASAQFEVAAMLTDGVLIAPNLTAAASWYERSAAQGFTAAQYRLGNLYETGRGVTKDLDLARLWYQRAAEAGNRMSMHNLASLYAGGEMQTQDFAASAHWFGEAAKRGLTDSQFNLATLYARGLGVTQDFEESYKWFALAAQAGDVDAKTARDDVARSLDTASVQRLEEELTTWKPQSIELAANFAPIGTWDPEFNVGETIDSQDVVQKVQTVLSKLGYDIGKSDGMFGPKTRDAIKDFERRTGMSETGVVNPRLLAVLVSQPV